MQSYTNRYSLNHIDLLKLIEIHIFNYIKHKLAHRPDWSRPDYVLE
jgi:hypothetical protein